MQTRLMNRLLFVVLGVGVVCSVTACGDNGPSEPNTGEEGGASGVSGSGTGGASGATSVIKPIATGGTTSATTTTTVDLPQISLACVPTDLMKTNCAAMYLESVGLNQCLQSACDYQQVGVYCEVSLGTDAGAPSSTQKDCIAKNYPLVSFLRACMELNGVKDLSTIPPPPQDKVEAVYACYNGALSQKK